MAITQAQYDAYEAQAIAAYAARSGAKAVSFADQSITFDSWDEIWAWLRWLKGQIASGTANRTRYAATSKGC